MFVPSSLRFRISLLVSGLVLSSVAAIVNAHGDVTPQKIDASSLPALGDTVHELNPYRGNAKALELGKSAYAQNCARCHGIDAVSGGIAPDLRLLPALDEGDDYFANKVRKGVVRNGMTYMPGFGEVIGEEGLWAIRTYLDSVYTEE